MKVAEVGKIVDAFVGDELEERGAFGQKSRPVVQPKHSLSLIAIARGVMHRMPLPFDFCKEGAPGGHQQAKLRGITLSYLPYR